MSRKLLITGGAGFIGSNLVAHFNKSFPDWEIQVIDDLSTGLRSNLNGLRCNLLVESILDPDVLEEVCANVDNIVHLAAIGSVPRSISAPRPTHDANITGTLNVLEAAKNNRVKHVVVASSSSVYGSNPKLPRSEFDWTRPLSPYAVSKLATEAYAGAYSSSYGLKTVAFRFFNVYGPRQRADHPYAAVIPKFISAAKSGDTLTIHGDGGQTRDFTFVDSVCEAIGNTVLKTLAFDHPVNLAFGARHSILEVVGLVEDILGIRVKTEHTDPREGDVFASQSDTDFLQRVLPGITTVDIKVGLKKTLEWFDAEYTYQS